MGRNNLWAGVGRRLSREGRVQKQLSVRLQSISIPIAATPLTKPYAACANQTDFNKLPTQRQFHDECCWMYSVISNGI